MTLESWRTIKVLDEVQQQGGRVTVPALADLVRGLGGGAFPVVGEGRKRKVAGKSSLDLTAIAGGKVSLSKDVSGFAVRH